MTGRPQRRDSRPAAQADQIVQNGVAAQAELFGHVTGNAGTKVARAGADKKRVELLRPQVRSGQRPGQGNAGETRCLATECRVQFVRRKAENLPDVAQCKMAGGDAAVSCEDGPQDKLRPPVEALHGW